MRMVQLTKQEKENILENLLKRSPNQYDEYQEAVNEILENVKKEGDKAVFDYTKRFDKADIFIQTFGSNIAIFYYNLKSLVILRNELVND